MPAEDTQGAEGELEGGCHWGCLGAIAVLPLFILFFWAGVTLVCLVIAISIVWTAIWLATKLVAVVLLLPACILEVCCSLSCASRALHWVIGIRWDWWEPLFKADPAPIAPHLAAAAAASARSSLSSRNSQAAAPANATAPQGTTSPVDRDLELGLPEEPSPPPSYATLDEMDITDSIHSEEAVPPYEFVCPSEPAPEYEEIESGRYVWG
ncbi:hypothetical protein PG993_010479 [Apiospora rasikravindrae]|uniref:Uncharacterized protein n=1 Tax=Apiospora rasikravindrae TaxID=990691 RepID=A0ABR1SME6_9PEZI